MTIIGPDRPGLVEILSTTIASHDGNWMESRLAHLGGRFAGLIRVEAPDGQIASLQATLTSLPGLTVVVEQAESSAIIQHDLVHLELLGQDHPGIVQQISAVIARHGFNVEELSSSVISAPMSGEPLFKASLSLRGPGDSTTGLRAALEKLASDLMVETTLG